MRGPTGHIKVGLALSGGGVRAAVFHLGVLARLAVNEMLEDVTFISTVSGGSMVTGLIYALSRNGWPTSRAYLETVLPEARMILTRRSLQRDFVIRSLRKPWLLGWRANVLSESLQRCWGLTGLISDLAREPRWVINATTYESGKRWYFVPQRMGDYIVGYIENPRLPIADAVAASAAFPGLIGPYVLNPRAYTWAGYVGDSRELTPMQAPTLAQLHLWDGGVYDNLGAEALFKPGGQRFRDEYNFLLISDASGGLTTKDRALFQGWKRLLDIATDQVRGLRARTLFAHFNENANTGAYLRMGLEADQILSQAGIGSELRRPVVDACLSLEDARLAASLPTDLKRLPEAIFDRLCRHGWEVADCTLHARCPNLFQHIPCTEGVAHLLK